jgi:methylated-DNA-[protein]-cysteine S-methyltransferase
VSGCAFALFDTAIGRCALIWRDGAIFGASLPEKSEERMLAAIARRFPNSREAPPPPEVAAAIGAVQRLLAGETEDFVGVEVDLSALATFERRVLEEARAIPCGETRTYGQIAASIGAPDAARAVGRALGRNPVPIIIPCHRVVGTAGKSGGFSAPGGASTKFRILQIERARLGSDSGLFADLPLALKPLG